MPTVDMHPVQDERGRQVALDAAHRAHPERFVHGPPTHPTPPPAVWINPPATAIPTTSTAAVATCSTQGGPQREAATPTDHHEAASREDRTARPVPPRMAPTLAGRAERGTHSRGDRTRLVRLKPRQPIRRPPRRPAPAQRRHFTNSTILLSQTR